jgi:hypothetical protein
METYALLGSEDVRKLKAVCAATRGQVGDAGEVYRLACNILAAGRSANGGQALYKAACAADTALAHDLGTAGISQTAWDNLAAVAESLAMTSER